MSGNSIRIPIEQAGELQLADIRIIRAVGRGDDSHRYVELMSDLQHLPLEDPNGGGGAANTGHEGDANLLLVEVDDPNDSECLRDAVDRLRQHEHLAQRLHCFKQY